MATHLFTILKAAVGSIELNDVVFGVEVNEHLHTWQKPTSLQQSSGTQSAKTRSEVSGIWEGNLETERNWSSKYCGSTRSPQWTGRWCCICTKAKRLFIPKMNKKEKKNCSSFSIIITVKVADNKIVFMDAFNLDG